MRDLFCIPDTFPNADPNRMDATTQLEIIKQKILMCLYTNRGEVLGAPDFGCSLDDYLWEPFPNPSAIQNQVQSQIEKWISVSSEEWDIATQVDIDTSSPDGEPVCMVRVYINGQLEVNETLTIRS
jgi:phage baseplate assembly protein W